MNDVTNIVQFYRIWYIFSYFYLRRFRKSSFVKNSAYLSLFLTSKGTNLFSIDSLEGTDQ